MLRKWFCQADVTVTIFPVDPLLIKSGYATLDGPDMVPVTTFKEGQKTYYLPGSSLKGVLRSHLERIARTLHKGSVCIPYLDPKKKIPVPVPEEQESFGCGYRSRGKNETTSEAYQDSCATCRLFGSLKFGGRFSIGDAYPLPDHKPALEHRNGVGLDRFTGGTVPGVLFDMHVLVGGKYETKIRLVNFELWQLSALHILLADLADEMISVGSGRSRGLGRVKGEVTAYTLSYMREVSQLVGLYQLSSEEEQAAYGLHDWEPASPISLPSAESKGLRRQYNLTPNWWMEEGALLIPALDSFLQCHGGPQSTADTNSSQEG